MNYDRTMYSSGYMGPINEMYFKHIPKYFRSFLECGVQRVAPFQFEQPIFIIAPPRSGSTFLFECLARSDEVFHLNHEADSIWWRLFPYDRLDKPSDLVTLSEVSDQQLASLRRATYRAAARTHFRNQQLPIPWWYQLGFKPIRYLDKTIANCFHLEVIDAAFPGARYIFLVRDPLANISSMIEGWPYLNRFGKAQLDPYLKGDRGALVSHWTYPAPPGWQEVICWPVEKICAWSWKQHVDYALAFFRNRDDNVIWIQYEDLRDDTISSVETLAGHLDLKMTQRIKKYLRNPPPSKTTVSKPAEGKWKTRNPDDIRGLISLIRETSLAIGYPL